MAYRFVRFILPSLAILGVVLGTSSRLHAEHSQWTEAQAQRGVEFAFDFDSVQNLQRQPTSRSAAFHRLVPILGGLLAHSDLTDNSVPAGRHCPANRPPSECGETYLPPVAPAQWRTLDADFISQVHAQGENQRAHGGPRRRVVELGGLRVVDTEDGTTVSRDGVFRLRVAQTGEAFRFINYLNDYEKLGHRDARLDAQTAEQMGRDVIEQYGLAPLGPNETLSFIKTTYVHFTGNASDPGDRVVGTRAYFGRAFGNVPVIGEGSHIVIEFTDGVRSIKADWATLTRRDGVQRVVEHQEFLARFVEIRHGADPALAESSQAPFVLCGLRDGGARSGSSTLELGCIAGDPSSDEGPSFVPIHQDEWSPAPFPAPGTAAASAGLQASRPAIGLAGHSASCSTVTGETTDGRAVTSAVLLLVAAWCWRRRRPTSRAAVVAGLAAAVLVPVDARAVSGTADYNYFMYKTYASGSGYASMAATQYQNRDDWNSEMSDIASCGTACESGSSYLYSWLYDWYGVYLGSDWFGLNADLILVQTHGLSDYPTGVNFQATMVDYEGDHVYSRSIAPNDADTDAEIAIWQVCHSQTLDSNAMWYGWRNLHHHGLLVSAGCYGSSYSSNKCYLTDVGYNTTFNELGDSIADSEQHIMDAWSDAHDLAAEYYDDDISIFGLGAKSEGNCDNRARNVSFQNRLDYEFYSVDFDEPSSGPFELCGYYWSNL